MSMLRELTGFVDPLRRLRTLEKVIERLLRQLSQDECDAHLELAPRLPEDRMCSARLYPDREAMLHALPKGGVVGEVGTWKGDFSCLIANICAPDVFHLFDIDFTPLVEPHCKVERHLGDSSTSLDSVPEGSFDWLYIDGDHSYAGASKDLRSAHRVIKPGGSLMCNDYTNWCSPSVCPYGVARAVNEFIVAHDYVVDGLALHPAGLYDILIRKPE